MPLVEAALRLAQDKALAPPPEAVLLEAGARRVCGADFEKPGCRGPGVVHPRPGETGPEAARGWRAVLESALAAASLEEGERFDKVGFQRYVMDAMVEALGDPASFYVLPAVYRKIAAIPASFVGFGMTVEPAADALVVVAVHEGSPAWDAGLVHGDRIVRVNGQGVTGYLRPLALAALWGADGEKVEIAVRRGAGALRTMKLAYAPWPFAPFSAQRRGEVAVVRVRSFEPGLAAAVRAELAAAPGGLVLDLRDAAGGGEEEMVAVADALIGAGAIGAKQMRDELGCRSWSAAPASPGERTDVPIAVVLNGGTSGLAEVLAAALRAHRRAILIGRRTAGSDTLETMAPFADGSAIQITSTRLLGPDGAALADGVAPHVETPRLAVVDLAVAVLAKSRSAGLDDLIAAARDAVAAP